MVALFSLLPLLGALVVLDSAEARPHARDANQDIATFLKSNMTRTRLPGAPSTPLQNTPAINKAHKRDLPVGWTSYGCYYDAAANGGLSGGRMLSAYWGTNPAMTVETCLAYCTNNGYAYAGLSPASYCHCDNAINTGTYGIFGVGGSYGGQIDSSYCQTPCLGNPSEICGGSGGAAFSVYYGPNAAAAQSSASSAAAASSSKASSASAYSASVTAAQSVSAASASAASATAAAASKASSLSAFSASSIAAYSSSVSSVAAAASASIFSATSAAAASASKASSLAASSAAAYSSSVSAALAQASAANASAVAASISASASSVSAAAASSAAAYSSSVSAALAQASAANASAVAASISASASSVSAAAASSAAAYSSSVSAAIAQASAANASALAAQVSSSAASVAAAASSSAAAYSSSVSAAIAQASAANASVLAAQVSSSAASVAAAASSSAAAYSSSVSAAIAQASAANASALAAQASASASVKASISVSLAAFSSSSAAAYSSSSAAAYSSSSAAAASSSSAAAAAASATALPSGWVYATVGVAEGSNGRALVGASISTQDMTPSKCSNYCTSQGYPIAGLEYSSQCFCGNYLTNGASLTLTSNQCNMACSGASNVTCGGPNCLTLMYSTSATAGLASDLTQGAPALPSGWAAASTSCIAEGTSGRALTGASTSSSSMTAATCVSFCSSKGFPISGVEYGSECYCGSALSNGASLTLPSSQCNMPCSGAGSQTCGGPNALNLYVSTAGLKNLNADLTAKSVTLPTGWTAAATTCIAEGTSGRALSGASWSSNTMTPTACINYCAQQGYALAGVEYSTQCFCGPTLTNGASLTKQSSNCWMTCGGDGTQICGGPSALNLYVATASLASLSSDFTSVAVSLPSGWAVAAQTCVAEGTSGRALTGASTSSPQMTPGMCASFCTTKGFQYAGVEYGSECYCGNSFSNGASLTTTSNSCWMSCSGASGTICGGPGALSLYVNPALAPAAVAPINGFSAGGCVQEVAGRALTGAVTTSPFMTVEMCTSFCASKGFTVAGVEYASECYCGNQLVNGASLGLVSGQCNMPCSGNANEICGGPNAINLYSIGTISSSNPVGNVVSSATSALGAATTAVGALVGAVTSR